MLKNASFTAFIVSEILREIQQGDKSKYTSYTCTPRLRLSILFVLKTILSMQNFNLFLTILLHHDINVSLGQ